MRDAITEIETNRTATPHGTTDPSRRVLMIACAFPPTGGPGVQRTLKFAKYLPNYGWRPEVWASEPLPGLPEDRSLLADIPPEVIVHRVRQDRAAQLAAFVDRLSRSERPGASILGRGVASSRAYRARRLLPDDQIGWARRSLTPLARLIGAGRFDLIYSTFSPASNHWLALQLKHRTGLPWVADFRDLWTDDYRYDEPSARRRAAHRSLEHDILATADAVIGVSERQTELLAGHLNPPSKKFHTITNGFDPDDFSTDIDDGERDAPCRSCGFGPDTERFTIAHVGRLDRRRTPDALIQGLARFAGKAEPAPNRIVFQIVGHVSDTVFNRLAATGLSVHRLGSVSHCDAIAHMKRADLLLLPVPLGPNADSVIPAKLFEYLATGRPILVTGPNGGQAARIVTRCRAGHAVGFDSPQIADALSRFRNAWAAGRALAGCAPDQLEQFSRVRLTRELAAVFDKLVGRASPRSSDTAIRTHTLVRTGRAVGSSCLAEPDTVEVV